MAVATANGVSVGVLTMIEADIIAVTAVIGRHDDRAVGHGQNRCAAFDAEVNAFVGGRSPGGDNIRPADRLAVAKAAGDNEGFRIVWINRPLIIPEYHAV